MFNNYDHSHIIHFLLESCSSKVLSRPKKSSTCNLHTLSFPPKNKKCDTYFLYKIIDFFLVTLPKSISSLQFQQNITQAINKHNIFTGNKLNKGHHMCSQKNKHHLGTTFSQFWYSSSFTDGATYKSKQLRIS